MNLDALFEELRDEIQNVSDRGCSDPVGAAARAFREQDPRARRAAYLHLAASVMFGIQCVDEDGEDLG